MYHLGKNIINSFRFTSDSEPKSPLGKWSAKPDGNGTVHALQYISRKYYHAPLSLNIKEEVEVCALIKEPSFVLWEYRASQEACNSYDFNKR